MRVILILCILYNIKIIIQTAVYFNVVAVDNCLLQRRKNVFYAKEAKRNRTGQFNEMGYSLIIY